MRLLSGKAFCKAIEKRGWILLRINGSHHIYGKDGERARLTIPVHGNEPLKRGLQAALMKTAGLVDGDL